MLPDDTGPIHAVLPPTRDWPLHGAARSRAIERAAIAAHPGGILMHRAGGAVARLALALAPHARLIRVFAGPGNNGGDGLVAATWLHRAGIPVRVTLVDHGDRAPEDARAALLVAQRAGVAIDTALSADSPLAGSDLAIDALLGLGASRAPDGAIAEAIRILAGIVAPVLAVDLPTGLDGDSGRRLGPAVVHAAHTLALLTLKPGLFTADGRDHAGRVWLAGLAVEKAEDDPDAILSGPDAVRIALPERKHGGHKGRFGDCLVVAGDVGMGGAALLASRAAIAAGAGRVYIGLLDPAAAVRVDEARPELMVRPLTELNVPEVLARSTVVCGCGGGHAVAEALPNILAHAHQLVLDADALNAIAADPELRRALIQRAAAGLASVLTPHPLEAARLLGCGADQVQASRLACAQVLATELGATIVLKGSGTVIAGPDTTPKVNASGSARLASAGTGDVLAGWLGGLWSAQPACAPATLAAAAVWLHGRAGESGDQRLPLLAGDLMTSMARAVEATATGAPGATLAKR